jgi:hypothetical protein
MLQWKQPTGSQNNTYAGAIWGTVPGMVGIKGNNGGGSIQLLHYKNFGKCLNVPPVQQSFKCKIKKILDSFFAI